MQPLDNTGYDGLGRRPDDMFMDFDVGAFEQEKQRHRTIFEPVVTSQTVGKAGLPG